MEYQACNYLVASKYLGSNEAWGQLNVSKDTERTVARK